MVQLVIFDMAGTSINEDNLVYKTIQQCMTRHGVPVSLELVLEHGAGKEKRTAIGDIAAVGATESVSEEWITAVHTAFKKELDTAYDTCAMEVFPSVRQVIKTLKEKGIAVGFNTGYSRAVAEKILGRVGVVVGKDIDALATADDVTNGRPAPDMIDLICQEVGIPAAKAVKIGDSAIDIVEGKNAGVKYAIGVTTGAQDRPLLTAAEADYVLDDMLELLVVLDLKP